VPDNTIPAGLTAHRHHAVHHVVGRIKHTIHHKFPIAGPPPAAPNPFGCEKHAIVPGPAGHGIAGPAVTGPKLAALGGAGAGLVALGTVGGLVAPFFPGRVSLFPPGKTPVGTTPVTTTPPPHAVPPPPTILNPPPPVIIPGTPPVTVSEPATIVMFTAAAGIALLARHVHRRRPLRAASSG